MAGQVSNPITSRRVFYIPGYDPIHPRRYRELYRAESAKQAAISGYSVDMKAKTGGRYGWQVNAQIDGSHSQADFAVLVWSDIVRKSMGASVLATYGQMLRTAWIYLTSGTLRRLMWLRKGPVIAALYPIVMLLLQLGLAVLFGMLAGSGVAALVGWGQDIAAAAFTDGAVRNGWPLGERFVFWPVFLAGSVYLLRWFKEKDGKLFAYYLTHDYAHACQLKGAYPPELEARLVDFVAEITAALQDDSLDEVLVVGHSSGAYLGVSVLADVLRETPVRSDRPALSFLSLGQVIPMVSFLPKADRLRADLNYLSAHPDVTWVDVSAPGDGCAFALCDPVAVSGVAPKDQMWPLILSAAFTQTLAPDTYKSMRWRFFRLHFQYLCAFDRPGDYDYFQITAGPLSLAARYQDRAPSKSRIDVPASPYTSMAA